jgi:hypothetical protein
MQRSISINKYPNTPLSQNAGLEDRLFHELKEKVFMSQPELRTIINAFGDMTLFEYSKRYNEPNTAVLATERRTQFIATFADEVKRLLDEQTAESCKKQLETTYRVTTTDHHGPMSEGTIVNSNLHEALPYLNGDETIKNIIVLGCANVSFDNETFPRGLLFHSKSPNGVILNQLAFYPRAVRPCPVIFFPAYTAENIQNAYNRIDGWEKENAISNEQCQKLKFLINEIYADPSVLACKYFSEQVTKTNFTLWKKIMKFHPDAPNLIYIEQEGIVTALLDNYHLDQNTMIHKLLFTPHYHELILKHFDGVMRGFSTKNKVGTYLFWALPKGAKYRVQLWKNGNYLETEDGSYKIHLTPEGLRKAIREKELIPSTLFSFILLSFYYGIRLTGGKTQTTYLTQMKKAFIDMQKEYGDLESIMAIETLRTTDLSMNIQSLCYLQTDQESRLSTTGIDLIMYKNKATMSIVKTLAKVLTLKEVFYRALPDFYKRFYREEEQDLQLASITKEDLEKYLGLEHIIKSSANIR